MTKPKLHIFEKSLLSIISRKDYISYNQNIIIAVSGGRDSMALLYAMIKLNHLLKINIFVAHINNHLRENSILD